MIAGALVLILSVVSFYLLDPLRSQRRDRGFFRFPA
jgi:hypothetical protein